MLTGLGKQSRVAVVLMVLGVAGASTAWAATQETTSTTADPTLSAALGAPTAPVSSVPSDVRDRFVLLRDRPATGMPADVAAMAGSSVRFGRNASLARKIDTVTGAGWIIPGDGYVCIAVKDPVDGYGTSCVPSDVAERQGVSVQLGGALPDGQVAMTVLAPDGTKVVRSDGSAVVVRDGVASVLSNRVDDLRVVQ